MNYMPEIAKLLGVEIGEQFKVKYTDDDISSLTYRFTEYSLNEIEDGKVRPYCYGILTVLLNGTNSVVKLPKPILTDKEKEDLSGIIRLFRDEVISICKFESMRHCGYEFLSIKINNNVFKYETTLPYFKKGTMYKGMKLEKKYSLEELGL